MAMEILIACAAVAVSTIIASLRVLREAPRRADADAG
jgi:hypothetical protein